MTTRRATRTSPRSKGRQHAGRRERNQRSISWGALALWLVCAEIAIFVLVFDTNAVTVFDLPKAALSHALAWGLLGVLIVLGLGAGIRVPVSPLFVAFYLMLAVAVITTVTAENKYIAIYGDASRYLGLTTHTVLALITVAVAVGLDYPRRVPWLAWTVAGISVLAGVYAIQQAIGADPVRWTGLDAKARPFATFGNPDYYGQFLAVVGLGSAAVLAFSVRRLPQWAGVAVALVGVMSLALMVIVATRGSLVGVVAGGLILGALWLRRAGLSRAPLTRFAIAAVASAFVVGVVLITTPLGARALDISRGVGIRDRELLYDSAARMFVDHPVVGVGLDNFSVFYPRYQQAEWFSVFGVNLTNSSAHNWVLHTAATNGIVGLLATFGLLGAFAFYTWKRARDPEAVPLLVAAVSSAAFYGSGLVLPGGQSIQWIPWVCLGVALASDLKTARAVGVLRPLRIPQPAQYAIVAGLAAVALTQFGSWGADRSAKSAEVALSRPDGQGGAVEAARSATAADPGRAAYWNDLGRALERAKDFAGARVAYREATSRSPYTPAFWWNLAPMELQFAKQNEPGAREAALTAMQRAIAASPENPESFDRLARVQYNLADYAGAVENEKRAIAILASEPKYYSQASEAARQLKDATAAIDFLQRGVAATDSNDLRLTLAIRLIESSRHAEARQVLRDLVAKDPSNKPAADLLRQLEAVP
jgi:O-antigen ligase/cytochrome c-type biogenesis protein CcmH/NrfG